MPERSGTVPWKALSERSRYCRFGLSENDKLLPLRSLLPRSSTCKLGHRLKQWLCIVPFNLLLCKRRIDSLVKLKKQGKLPKTELYDKSRTASRFCAAVIACVGNGAEIAFCVNKTS